MDNIKYYLVLEKRLGDYSVIDINKLDICEFFVSNDLASIDTFTSKFTESEIRDSIKRSNMAKEDYLLGNLKIISDVKHNFKILSKEIFDVIVEFQNNDLVIDGVFKSKLFGSYKKIVEKTFDDSGFIKTMLDRFKDTLKNGSKIEIFKIIEELPYQRSRLIYFTIYEEIRKRNIENIRKLERMNDVA